MSARCIACLTPTAKPWARLCPTCYSWHTYGRPPKPADPDVRDVARMVAGLTRRAGMIENTLLSLTRRVGTIEDTLLHDEVIR